MSVLDPCCNPCGKPTKLPVPLSPVGYAATRRFYVFTTLPNMQRVLEKLDLSQLQLLKKVFSNALEHPDEDKYRLLKHTNEMCQTRILSQPKMLAVLTLVGFGKNPNGDYLLGKSDLLAPCVAALDVAISLKRNQADTEYHAKQLEMQIKQAELDRKLALDKQRQQLELGKISQIQADVRQRPVVASIADATMGHGAAAEGIFAGAGGKSSSAKTFKDLGVNVND
ncbi:hypothetical protein BASA81_006485 [Batrachochytrium salamandrivorans]|nr:hypothetical protein BASA81_006485 [Batrachochytrium salamandrivorans]